MLLLPKMLQNKPLRSGTRTDLRKMLRQSTLRIRRL